MSKGCCLDCTDRTQLCHTSCLKYKEYRQKLDDYNMKVQKYKLENNLRPNRKSRCY